MRTVLSVGVIIELVCAVYLSSSVQYILTKIMDFWKGCAVKRGEYLCRGNTTAASIEKTAEHCAKQCYNTPTCMAWTFGSTPTADDRQPTPDNCWLKTTAECKGSNPDWMWGPRECGNLTGSLTMESVVVFSTNFGEGQVVYISVFSHHTGLLYKFYR